MLKTLFTAAIIIAAPLAAQAKDIQKATFAGGCFWCVESDLEGVKGVKGAVSGFTGGRTASPTYKSHGNHIEAVQVTFDADVISYETLVDKFLRSIDVVDSGGQFCDRGHAYTSAVFAKGGQGDVARSVISKHNASGKLPKKIVTPVLAASKFYPVGEYHQDYYKSKKRVVTRRGPMTKAKAYKFYRNSCGRDARVKQLWGAQAFSGH
jgi:peptide-methionine (S)-S-oxide reductase